MEESLPASLLVLAGLLRLAGVSQSEPWSSRPAGQSSLEGGLVTMKTRPVSPGEGDEAEATLRFDRVASTLAAVPPARDATEGVTEEKEQLPTTLATARESERPERLLDAATAGPQRDAPSTSKPLAGLSALPGTPKPESSSLPRLSAKFLSREEQAGHSTAQEFKEVEWSTPVPSKMSAVEPFSTLMVSSDSLERAGRQVTLSTSLWPATVAGDLGRFTLIKNTEAEEPDGQTVRTSAGESLETRLTIVPESGPHTPGRSQPAARTDSGSPDIFKTAGHPARPPSPSVALRFSATSWPTLSEEPVAIISRTEMAPQASLASSQHGEMREHKLRGRGKAGSPPPLTPSQSSPRPFPLWSAPGTPSLRAASPPAFQEDIGQSSLARLLFSPQFPSSSKPPAPTKVETCITLTLPHGMGHRTAAQDSHFRLPQAAALLEGPLPASRGKEATLAVSGPADSKPQLSAARPSVRGLPQVRVPGMTPTADSVSSLARPAMSAMAASSKAGSPSPAVPAAAAAAAGETSRFRPRFQLPATPSSVYGEQPLPSALAPEPAASSSALAPAEQQTPDVPRGLKRLAGPPPPPHVEPLLVSALAQTKAPSPGHSAARHAELSTSAVMDSAPSRLKTPADGELQERVFGLPVSYPAEQGMLGNSASTHARATAPGASSPRLESGAASASAVARLSVPGAPRPRPTPSADVHARTLPLLAEVSAEPTPPAVPVHTSGEPSVSVWGTNVPYPAKPQVPGRAASSMDESHLLATAAPARAKPKMEEATAESRLAASTTAPQRAGVSVSAHTSVQSLVFSAPTEPPLSGVSAKLGTQQHNETRAPEAPSSPPSHHQLAGVASRGQLEPEPPSTFAWVDTSPQPPHTSANSGTQTRTLSADVRPGSRHPATTAVPSGVPPRSPEKESEGKPSPRPFPLLMSHTGVQKAAWPGVSALPLGGGSSRLDSPASRVSRGSEVNPPSVSGALVAGGLPGLRTTPVSAVPDARDLTYSPLGSIQPLTQSDVPAARSLDSLAAGKYLGMPPSLHYLSVLVRNAENMVCLQPLQDSTAPPPGAPNASGRGAASVQEMLLLSSSLGFPHLAAPSLAQSVSPSGVVLVKPMLVFLPADKPDIPVWFSAEEEKGAPRASLPFASEGSGPLGGSQEQPMEATPTLSAARNSTEEDTLTANSRPSEEQVVSGPALNASLWPLAGAGRLRPSSVMPVPSHYGLAERSARTRSLKGKGQGEGFPSPALDSPGVEENHPVLLPVGASAEHHVSVPPSVPVVASLQQGPKSSPAAPALRSLTEPSASRRRANSLLTSGATERPQQGLRTALGLQAPAQGFVTPLAAPSKDSEGPSRASSAGDVELPLETERQFTLSRPASASLRREHPATVRSVPSVASDVPALSSEQRHQISGALNDPHSDAVLEFPVATEMASYPAKATSSRPPPTPRQDPPGQGGAEITAFIHPLLDRCSDQNSRGPS
ncbi:hypothetical protein lerEdw1_007623 [Lerista edwardsae]|nr:hypothetical protein lerEdw1_007623 [Lerista edwardsae]